MKIKKIYIVSLVLLILSVFIGTATSAEASTSDSSAGGAAGFTYNVNFPENQMGDAGYFNLQMSPSQQQTVSISLINPSEEDIVVEIGINGAKTNQNGVLEYGETNIENDASLKFDFADIVTGPDTVEIPAGESRDLELNIQMPETTYDGIILGGIRLQKQDSDEEAEEVSGSVVNNKFAYAIAMILQETDTAVAADLQFNQVYPGTANYRNTIFINYSNTQATILNDMSTEVQITNQGESTVLYETKKTQMRMAPNTQIDFPISMNGEQMVAGNYTATILVTAGDQRWEWSEDFEITQEQADEFNERDIGLVQEKGIDWKLIALIVAGFIAVVVILVVVIQVIKKNKKQREKAERLKRRKLKKQHNA